MELGEQLADPLILVRAIHLASTIMATGRIIFVLIIAEPALKAADPSLLQSPRKLIDAIFYASLAVAVCSGIAWFFILAIRISGHPESEVIRDNTARILLTETRFGLIGQTRLVCAVLLAGVFAARGAMTRRLSSLAGVVALAVALWFLVGLAWVGHSGAAPDALGSVQLCVDVLHLIAAGGWLGGLVPLALFLWQKRTISDFSAVAYRVTRRFSDFGIVCVLTLLSSGLINAWFLVGSLQAMTSTRYGWLLLTKIALFVLMLAFAATNRLYYLLRMSETHNKVMNAKALKGLERNTLVEIGLGLVVILIVGALGMMPPAAHVQPNLHVH